MAQMGVALKREQNMGRLSAQNSCLGKRHPDGMPSDNKINLENC